MKIQLKRSNVLEGSPAAAKEPTADQMEYGELAVNYNTDDPAIFIKANDNSIVRIAGVGNIADDGQVEVPSNISPPSNPEPGNLWFNPVDGRLYVYYDDGNSQQWVDASPDSWNTSVIPDPDGGNDQPGTLDDRYVKQTGDNMTGNLTLGTDKIELYADGLGRFKDLTVDKEVSGGQAVVKIKNSSTDANSSAELRLFSSDSGTNKFRAGIRADSGSGTEDNGQLTFRLRKNSAVIDRVVVDTDGNVKIGGTLPSSPNIELNANGSIVAKADATINTLTVGLGSGSVSSNTAIGQSALNSNTTGNSNTAVGLNGLRNNLTGNNNTALGRSAGYYIEGSNNTILGAYEGTSADWTLSNTVIISAGTTARAWCNSSGSWLFGSTLPSSPNISLNTNGSATFTNKVTSASTQAGDSGNTLVTKDYIKDVTDATTSVKGIVKLNSAVNQTDETTAATPLAVKQAYDLATNANTAATTANTLASAALPKSGGTMTGDITFSNTQTIPTSGLPTATTAQSGIVQLNNSVNSTSTTRAATSKAVKDAYDLAQTAIDEGGGALISTDFKDLSVNSDSVFTIPSNTKRLTLNIVGLKCNSTEIATVIMAIGSSTSIWTNGQNQDNHSTVFFLDGVDPVFQETDNFIPLGFNTRTNPLSANLTFSRIVSGSTCYFAGSGTSHSIYVSGGPVVGSVTSCDVESSQTVSRIAIGVIANNGNPNFNQNTSGFIGISYYSEL